MFVETDMHRTTETLVQREVMLCLSSMVSTLASGVGHVSMRTRDYPHEELIEQAAELCAPMLDYEEAARQAGWKTADMTPGMWVNDARIDPETQQAESFKGNAKDLCFAYDVEPYEWEVFEHWAVSNWLAEKLIAEGERVDTDFAGLNVWARTTTGQAISMDAVIQKIAKELFKL